MQPATTAAATTAAATTPAPKTVTTLPAVKVVGSGGQSVAALQKFADDVAAGRIDTLVAQCWTVASERLVATYTEDGRRTFLTAVSAAPVAGQYGFEWTTGPTVVDVSWAELGSSYACPHVTGGATPAFPARMDAALLVRRVNGRLTGSPVNAKDTAKNYPLYCDDFGDGSGAADADPALTAAQKAAVATLATSTAAVFTAQSPTEGVLAVGSAPAVTVRLEADLCVEKITG